MESLFIFILSYIVLFIIYIIFFYLFGLKRKFILDSPQVKFLKIKYKINKKDLNQKKIGFIICLIDPFIISFTGTIISLPNWNYILEILLGFILLMIMIFICYSLLGKILKRKVR